MASFQPRCSQPISTGGRRSRLAWLAASLVASALMMPACLVDFNRFEFEESPGDAGSAGRGGSNDTGDASSGGPNETGGTSTDAGAMNGNAAGAGGSVNENIDGICFFGARCMLPGLGGAPGLENCTHLPVDIESGECSMAETELEDCLESITDPASCDEYVNDKAAHPECGDAYMTFANACLRNNGKPPRQCDDWCLRVEECGLQDAITLTGCAQFCLEDLTRVEAIDGSTCADAVESDIECFSLATCPDIETLLDTGFLPEGCGVTTDQQCLISPAE